MHQKLQTDNDHKAPEKPVLSDLRLSEHPEIINPDKNAHDNQNKRSNHGKCIYT